VPASQIFLAVHRLLRCPRLVKALVCNAASFLLHPVERHWLNGWSLAPQSLQILVSDVCNFECRMCQYAYSESSGYRLNRSGLMSQDVFTRTIETTPGWPIVSLTGGEPLLNPHVGEYIRRIKAHGLFCTLTTNGWLLKEQASMLCDNGLDVLIISIDGDEETHDRLRAIGSYNRAVEGTMEILKRPVRPLVCISTVITDLNYQDLEAVFTLAEDLGVDAFNVNHLWIQTDNMVSAHKARSCSWTTSPVAWRIRLEAIDTDQVYDSLRSLQLRRRRVRMNVFPNLTRNETRIYYKEPEQLVKGRQVQCAWLVTRVWPNGDVQICREYIAGNVLEEPLHRIWNNQRYRSFRQLLVQNVTPPICSRCCLFFLGG